MTNRHRLSAHSYELLWLFFDVSIPFDNASYQYTNGSSRDPESGGSWVRIHLNLLNLLNHLESRFVAGMRFCEWIHSLNAIFGYLLMYPIRTSDASGCHTNLDQCTCPRSTPSFSIRCLAPGAANEKASHDRYNRQWVHIVDVRSEIEATHQR